MSAGLCSSLCSGLCGVGARSERGLGGASTVVTASLGGITAKGMGAAAVGGALAFGAGRTGAEADASADVIVGVVAVVAVTAIGGTTVAGVESGVAVVVAAGAVAGCCQIQTPTAMARANTAPTTISPLASGGRFAASGDHAPQMIFPHQTVARSASMKPW